MTHPPTVEEKPIDPEQTRFMARVKLMMALSVFATLLGIAVVLGVVGYRVFRSGDAGAPAEATVLLPAGARIMQTALVGDRILITIEVPSGGVEIRSFDAQSFRPAGRLRFATSPRPDHE
jgi:hypothetical protein